MLKAIEQDPKLYEAVAAMTDVGNSEGFVHKMLGARRVDIQDARAELSKASSEGGDDATVRKKYREQFIKQAYELCFKLLMEAAKPEKIKRASFADLMKGVGIISDRLLAASTRLEEQAALERGFGFVPDDAMAVFIQRAETMLSTVNVMHGHAEVSHPLPDKDSPHTRPTRSPRIRSYSREQEVEAEVVIENAAGK